MRRWFLITIILIGVFVMLNLFQPRSNRGQHLSNKLVSEIPKLVQDDNIPSSKLSYSYPTVESIFSENHSWTATLSAEKTTKILVTGDVLPARSVNAGVVARNNPLWPYEKVNKFINSLNADVTFVNLETPLLDDCPVTHEGMVFCGTSKNIEGLKAIGADVVSVANNHTGNYSVEGFKETLSHLKNAGMMPVGAGKPIYKNNKGVNFAFLGFNDIEKNEVGMDLAEEKLISAQIKEAKSKSDVVIVMYHWGTEYQSQPDERQRYLAYFTIDQGADLVVSNHPHWIQPVEFYKGKLIMYAHGNFIFDQMWSEETRTGVLGLYIFYDKSLVDVEFFPLKIFDYGQAVFLEDAEKQKVISDMRKESLILENQP